MKEPKIRIHSYSQQKKSTRADKGREPLIFFPQSLVDTNLAKKKKNAGVFLKIFQTASNAP